ncbi:16S rRNA (cytidine(1402)-2'-O)-methyltransferase [Levilactobacillus brevis]|uniref:16S rRNA (cytidine(1402)-2'-O)-methyltransferase n=1 Tax=Levilactobacillus brevis TaxID=1580 RepID=UPI00042046E6|nr:16S rRNA (cytidine(1402)-2'-O)-methyltransferase [Levilactobacillus brevis]KIO98180.1 rRNA small subunit methyltransferase I [Levilactobacillus brevis]KRK19845.1 methyltransferase [Levilactobacillus brevis ATCC 14869 = DSM 20054]MCT3572676.1 16S rRNA (cytidine(1402)-2'-O)-methyltransferase [Levilactobacillus brevis]SQG75560.1 ribosomal RNA small subunit methyltransferase I [Levilactobacillus brevis]
MEQQRSFQTETGGHLYLVPTPIGNLDDMTFRAVKTLTAVDLIAAEDTRNTQKLLNHFEITTKQISFHEHNTQERIPQLIAKLKQGMQIAQVSDAGMPSISDPGHELVNACIDAHIPVVPLPGANAGLTALIASGLAPQPFYFYGFLDRKPKDQKAEIAGLAQRPETLIFYEAPHRLKKTLQNLSAGFGDERPAVLCRELTKRYEEFLRGSLAELANWAATDTVRGEFVVLVGGNPAPTTAATTAVDLSEPIDVQVDRLIAAGEKPNDAIKEVAKLRGAKKQEIYRQYHHLDEE